MIPGLSVSSQDSPIQPNIDPREKSPKHPPTPEQKQASEELLQHPSHSRVPAFLLCRAGFGLDVGQSARSPKSESSSTNTAARLRTSAKGPKVA